jgi:hypothetical protein
MAGYIGNIPTPQATQSRQSFTATASQTTFATIGYTPNFLDVYLNGVHLLDGTDYTATNGSDVVLTVGAAVSDVVEVISYETFAVLDQTFTGTTTVTDSGAAPLVANRTTSDGNILDLQKDGSTVGSIGYESSGFYIDGEASHAGLSFGGNSIAPRDGGTRVDNVVDVGSSTYRFKDLYLSGGVYLGGTGSANKLDDYEEGDLAITFTPNTSGSMVISGAYNRAAYTKVGNLVTVTGLAIVGTVSSPVGYVKVPLPFIVANGTDRMNDSVGSCAVHNSNANMRDFLIMTTEGTTDAIIRLGDATTFQDDSGQAFKAGTQVYFSITYRTS